MELAILIVVILNIILTILNMLSPTNNEDSDYYDDEESDYYDDEESDYYDF